MKDVNKKMIDNLLKHSELLLKKTILLSEDIKTEMGDDTRLRLNSASYEQRREIIENIVKESEQIRKNSAQVLNILIQIQDLN